MTINQTELIIVAKITQQNRVVIPEKYLKFIGKKEGELLLIKLPCNQTVIFDKAEGEK